MPSAHAIQPSFAGGEFAPSLQARVDYAKYLTGAKQLRNFIVAPHGGAYNRAGFRYVATAKDSTHPVRIIKFRYSTVQSYTVELGHQYARFYFGGGQVQNTGAAAWLTATAYNVGDLVTQGGTTYYCLIAHTSGVFATDLGAGKWYAQVSTAYEIPTPWAGADLMALKFTQSADTIFFTHPGYAPQTMIRFGPGSWKMANYAFVNGPWLLQNGVAANTLTLSAISGNGITLTAAAALFQAGHVNALWKVVHQITGQTATDTITNSGTAGASIQCGSSWSLITSNAWTGTLMVQMSTDNGATWTTIQAFTSTGSSNYNTTGVTGVSQCLIRCITAGGGIHPLGGGGSTFSGTVQTTISSNSFNWVGIVQVTAVTNATTATANVLQIAGGTTATSLWSEGAWSTYRGWPSCCGFYQDRLWLANSPTQPQTLWGSRASSYFDHGISAPLVDADAININLPSQELNAIQSLSVLRDLVAVTAAVDWAILSSSGVITPTTVQAVSQGQCGAAAVQPIISGLRMIIVQPMGTVVRDLAFSIYTQSYDGVNLSIQSNHLFTGYTIADMAFQQEPDGVVWLVRSDGALLSLTYLPEQEVVAWTRHDTAGKFESITTIPAPGGGYNQLWAVVNRGGTRYIELMDNRMASTAPEDQFYVDCGLSLNTPVAITGMTAANPVVVTAPNHGFNNGDVIDIDDTVSGMDLWTDAAGNAVARPLATEDASLLTRQTIARNGYVVANKTANTFQLNDSKGNPVNGTALTAYVSGGNARKQVTAVTGIPLPDGTVVAVLANGFVQNSKTVAGGSINLDSGASRVQVGLGYTSDLETLALELPQQDGTIQGRKVKIPEVTLRLLNAAGGKIMQGEATKNLDALLPTTAPPVPGRPAPLFTGDLPRLSVPSGFDYGARLWIRQDQPLPITVLGVIPNVVVGA